MAPRSDHLLFGIDINASRARAVSSSPASVPRIHALDGEHDDLPLAVSLEGRQPEVGRAGVALSRRMPHLACLDFLPHLGTPRKWQTDRHRLDAREALTLVLHRLQPLCQASRGVVLTAPPYLAESQIEMLTAVALRAGLPVLGTVSAPLATALAAHAEQAWSGTGVVIDIDSHALTLTTVLARDDLAHVLDNRVLPHLGLRAWKERLLAAVADRCIRQSRRDPRDSAAAEQTLYDALEGVLDACRQGRMVELAVQTPHWYQNLILQPEEVVRSCAGLVSPVEDALEAVRAATKPNEPPQTVLLTAAAGRLPGLAAALQDCLDELGPRRDEAAPEEDFSAHLLDEDGEPPRVTVLAPDGAARAAHALAGQFLRGQLPAGHLDDRAPVPPPQPVDAGPARLHFRGQDYVLDRPSFVLGRQPACDLVFDNDAYPAVSGWHCEVLFDHRTFILRDRSRHGTLVNDRPVVQQVALSPGDWIRLGPGGPLLRFLGQAADPRRLITTA
jgi:hypothetical protein